MAIYGKGHGLLGCSAPCQAATGGQPVHCSTAFSVQATSAESNVASVASYLGLPVKILTTFVKGSPIAQLIKDNLRSRHIDYEGIEVPQGGPWGYRHQFNIADSGYGARGPRVWNDRAGEIGRTLNVKDFAGFKELEVTNWSRAPGRV